MRVARYPEAVSISRSRTIAAASRLIRTTRPAPVAATARTPTGRAPSRPGPAVTTLTGDGRQRSTTRCARWWRRGPPGFTRASATDAADRSTTMGGQRPAPRRRVRPSVEVGQPVRRTQGPDRPTHRSTSASARWARTGRTAGRMRSLTPATSSWNQARCPRTLDASDHPGHRRGPPRLGAPCRGSPDARRCTGRPGSSRRLRPGTVRRRITSATGSAATRTIHATAKVVAVVTVEGEATTVDAATHRAAIPHGSAAGPTSTGTASNRPARTDRARASETMAALSERWAAGRRAVGRIRPHRARLGTGRLTRSGEGGDDLHHLGVDRPGSLLGTPGYGRVSPGKAPRTRATARSPRDRGRRRRRPGGRRR